MQEGQASASRRSNRDSTRCIERAGYLLGMETSSVDSVEFRRFLLTPRDPRGMSRPLRLEFEGAFWHITSRGNERKDIFRQDGDRLEFLSLLATAVKRFRWRLHEYCLMTNHYHLVIETPCRTLANAMRVHQSESAIDLVSQ